MRDRPGRGPVWIWDPKRRRIAWANAAAARLWDAETIDDLLDLSFRPEDPITRVFGGLFEALTARAMTETHPFQIIETGEQTRLRAELVETGPDQPALLLSVVEAGSAEASATDFLDRMSKLYRLLGFEAPVPLTLFDTRGHLVARNREAELLLGREPHDLADLIGDSALAQRLISRAGENGAAGRTISLRTVGGPLAHRLTLRRYVPTVENGLSEPLILAHFRELPAASRYGLPEAELPDERLHPTGGNGPSDDEGWDDLDAHHPNRGQQRPRFGDRIRARARPNGPRGSAFADTLLDTVPFGVVLLGGDGDIVWANAAAAEMFGERESDPLLGRTLHQLFADEDKPAIDALLAPLAPGSFSSHRPREGHVTIIMSEDPPVGIELRARSFGSGPEVLVCMSILDLGTWLAREQQLIDEIGRTETINRERSAFLARVSHELRTPLNAILGFTEIMHGEQFGPIGNERYKGYVGDIHASGALMLSLVNDLLDLSKAEAGRLDLSPVRLDPRPLLVECAALMRPEADRAGLVLEVDLPEPLPKIEVDRRSLQQTLLNLLSNAVKYTAAGGRIILTARQSDARLTMTVADSGPGMAPEELVAALEPYRQVARTGKGRGKGTGLGLPLAKVLTEANGAEFSIASTPEHGTSINLAFRIVDGPDEGLSHNAEQDVIDNHSQSVHED